LTCHPAAYGFAYWAQDSDQEQASEFDGFIASCRPDMILFDIGAHFGLFSFAALHYGGATARAVAVDPSATAVRMMRIQSNLNDTGDRLKIVQAAAGLQTDWREMVPVGVISGGYMVAAGADHPASERTRTIATTVDKLAAEFGDAPTHIKIDAEGDEAEVLMGGAGVLSQPNSPLLFLELHNQMIRDRNADPEDTLLLLEKFQYETFDVNGDPISSEAMLSKPLIRIVAKRREA
jgi:FkbM family methyltransferase